jgi:hypothetical protein
MITAADYVPWQQPVVWALLDQVRWSGAGEVQQGPPQADIAA